VDIGTIFNIFVVDDERIIAESLAAILKQSGFATRSFVNPLDALHAAQSQTPDLLISDVMMPQLSGVELAILIKEQCPNCQILLFSGQAETGNLLEGARKRGHSFHLLAKPLHPSALIRRIRTLLPPASLPSYFAHAS